MIQEPTLSSGRKTADTAIYARNCALYSVLLIADGTNAASLVLYDNATAASGTKLLEMSIAATGTYQQFEISQGIQALNGIYADVTGTGAAFYVHFLPL